MTRLQKVVHQHPKMSKNVDFGCWCTCLGRMGWGVPAAMRVLEQILLHPCDDVARLVEWLAVDEQAGNLALSADGDECPLGIGIGRDVALGDGDAVIRQEALHLNAIRASGHNVQHELVMSSHRSPIGWGFD